MGDYYGVGVEVVKYFGESESQNDNRFGCCSLGSIPEQDVRPHEEEPRQESLENEPSLSFCNNGISLISGFKDRECSHGDDDHGGNDDENQGSGVKLFDERRCAVIAEPKNR